MNISLSPFAPENLTSRDGFGRPVPRQPARRHTQAGSGAYLRDSSRVPRRHPFHRVSPEFTGSRNCVPMAFTAESPPAQGQCVLCFLPIHSGHQVRWTYQSGSHRR